MIHICEQATFDTWCGSLSRETYELTYAVMKRLDALINVLLETVRLDGKEFYKRRMNRIRNELLAVQDFIRRISIRRKV